MERLYKAVDGVIQLHPKKENVNIKTLPLEILIMFDICEYALDLKDVDPNTIFELSMGFYYFINEISSGNIIKVSDFIKDFRSSVVRCFVYICKRRLEESSFVEGEKEIIEGFIKECTEAIQSSDSD